MELFCSADGFVDYLHPGQGVGDLAKAGFDGTLFRMPIEMDEAEYQHYKQWQKSNAATVVDDGKDDEPESMEVVADRVFGAVANKNLRLSVVRLRILPFKAAVYGLKRAEAMGVNTIIVEFHHPAPGQYRRPNEQEQWEKDREILLKLARKSASGTTFLLTNTGKELNGRMLRTSFSDAVVAAKRIDGLNQNCGEGKFGFALDTAYASLFGQDMQPFAETLGNRLKAVIISECDGHFASHLLPFTSAYKNRSAVDWLGLIRGLRQIAFDGALILDVRDTAEAFSPLLRPDLLRMVKSVGKFFVWQISMEQMLAKTKSLVLFGAGNMSRNFLKCYGGQHTPLYVTDNDKRRWGEEFCGLTIRPPEDLKRLPEDCSVVICNIYYREIEEQLTGMGIKNVAFFNDEYMPTFYFDRLKSKVN